MRWLMFLCLGVALSGAVAAADSFQVQIVVSGYPAANIKTTDGATALGYFNQSNITAAVPGYDGTQPVTVIVSHPGIKVAYQFPTASSSTLVVSIPALGLNKTFTGITRLDSKHLAFDYLKANGYLTEMMKLLTAQSVAHTPNDPVAGNPRSLLANLVQNDYDQQFLWRIGQPEDTGSELGAGFGIGTSNDSGATNQSRTITPFYRYRFEQNPGSELSLSLPLEKKDINGTEAYQGGAALSYRAPILERWTVAGGASYAVLGSQDAEHLAQYGGVSITSDLHWDAAGWRFAMGNLVGYYRTFKLGNFDPELHNTAFRNGLVASRHLELLGTNLNVDYFLIDTRYSGSPLYISDYQEAGIALRNSNGKWNWRASATVISAESLGGFINFSCSY